MTLLAVLVFALPASFRGRKVFIEFEGVRQIAEVDLNGHLIGVSQTGFTPFDFDLTPQPPRRLPALTSRFRFTLSVRRATRHLQGISFRDFSAGAYNLPCCRLFGRRRAEDRRDLVPR